MMPLPTIPPQVASAIAGGVALVVALGGVAFSSQGENDGSAGGGGSSAIVNQMLGKMSTTSVKGKTPLKDKAAIREALGTKLHQVDQPSYTLSYIDPTTDAPNGLISGYDGCNWWSGAISGISDEGVITHESVGSTKRACAPDAEKPQYNRVFFTSPLALVVYPTDVTGEYIVARDGEDHGLLFSRTPVEVGSGSTGSSGSAGSTAGSR